MKFKDIISIAKKVKESVEKDKKIPSKIDGKTYGQYGYILSKSINNIGKDIVELNIKNAPNPKGDSIKKVLTKNEYLSISKDINKFVSQNTRLPNYVKYQNTKISPKLFIYCFAKIIIFYNSEKRLPNTCEFNSKVFSSASSSTVKTKSKYGHATKSGCDNMGQNTSYYCAPHSMQEVIRNLYNIVIPQKTIASVMGTTSSGTGHDGIRTFVVWFNKKYNKNLSMNEKYFSDVESKGISNIIKSKNQDAIIHLAYKGIYGHYEVVNSISGSTWNIQNSLGSKCGSCYCGHKENRSYSTEKAWINAKSGVKSVLIFTRR